MSEEPSREVLIERINNLITAFAKSESVSLEWRTRFCAKLDEAICKLDSLPCDTRLEVIKGVKKDVEWLQRGAVAIISILFLLGVAWGTLANTVETNTRKWSNFEPEHQGLVKDVEVLKEKSYGYRGVPVVVKGQQ